MKTVILSALALAVANGASATPQTISVVGWTRLYSGTVQTIDLRGNYFVKNLMISAQGCNREEATFEVYSGGDVKGTVHVPGYDPSYVVTIQDNATSIQLKSISGGDACISQITANVDLNTNGSNGGVNSGNDEYLRLQRFVDIANSAISLTEELETRVTMQEDLANLNPIKKAAGRARASASGRGDASEQARGQLRLLRQEILNHAAFIDRLMDQEDSFDAATELLALADRIDDLMY